MGKRIEELSKTTGPNATPPGPKGITKKRPTREERQTDREVSRAVQTIDRSFRTRKGKQIEKYLIAIEEKEPGALQRLADETKRSRPPTKVGAKRIYSGKARSFEKKFSDDYWDNLATPWICAGCGEEIDPRSKGDDKRSIDHIKPWASFKLSLETADVCWNGVHWRVVYADTMRAAFQDESNLQPMHQNCNSGKNGPKNTDVIAPTRLGNCPGGELCDLDDATG